MPHLSAYDVKIDFTLADLANLPDQTVVDLVRDKIDVYGADDDRRVASWFKNLPVEHQASLFGYKKPEAKKAPAKKPATKKGSPAKKSRLGPNAKPKSAAKKAPAKKKPSPFLGAPHPYPSQKPKATRTPPADSATSRLLDLLKDNTHGMSAIAIRNALDLTQGGVKGMLKRLKDSGQIRAEGPRANLRYYLATTNGASAHTEL